MATRIITTSIYILFTLSITKAQEQKIKPAAEWQLTAQNIGLKSAPLSTPLLKEVDHTHAGDKWAVSVRPRSSRKHYVPGVAEIKQGKLQQKLNSYNPSGDEESSTRGVIPQVATNFEANWSIESVPPDNTMAIANNGNIITANNDGIEYYNGSGAFLYFDFWADFIDDGTLTSSFFDPKVIYDSGADRFVLIVLHGSNPNTSKILLCFSKTNNPLNGWWTYSLTGNPLNNGCWLDYPGLGVSNNEIYITGNLFLSSFNQAIIYQIPKAAGYAGDNLSWQYWSNLSNDPYKAFTIIPASYGHQGNYGPGIYLVSNESSGENKVRFWELTDDMSGTPQLFSHAVAVDPYSPAADALQKGTSNQLDNGDCRIQNAFYLNGIVHYVFHSDIGEGWNGIHYNRLDVSDGFNQSSTFGLQGSYDYSYPAVVPFSTSATDPSVMIAFLRSSEDTYPEIRVVNCDRFMQWSSSTTVKAGETFVDFLADDERWGDYTGIARRHNSADPRIWLAGCYGANISSQSVFHTFKTWVAEIERGPTVSTEENTSVKSVSVYPNPSYDLITIEFSAEPSQLTIIEIINLNGHVIRQLYRDTPREGENRLTFNKDALPAGTYIVSIKTNTNILKNETIVVLD